jgi:hypothetical protein
MIYSKKSKKFVNNGVDKQFLLKQNLKKHILKFDR